eukprot:7443689-Alexandrium_andersonii.AAC.1
MWAPRGMVHTNGAVICVQSCARALACSHVHTDVRPAQMRVFAQPSCTTIVHDCSCAIASMRVYVCLSAVSA